MEHLDKEAAEPSLTASEIQPYLVPINDTKSEAPRATRIIRERRRGMRLVEHGVRRNVLEWIRFLKCTDLFAGNRGDIRLADIAISDRGRVESLVDYHSSAEGFWVPAAAESR